MSTQLMQASRQWSSRPADERYLSLTDMLVNAERIKAMSASKVLANRTIQAAPVEGATDGLAVIGPNGAPVIPTHWAFSQLCSRAGAPAGYLRDLPAPLAADCVNYGLKTRDVEEIGVLLQKGEGSEPNALTAVTGPNYGRIWNATILGALVRRFGNGIDGDFRVPGEFGKRVEVTRENTTLYASDRDFFVFLADEKNKIEFPNRRNGESGLMSRGFFVWNSEVGAQTFGVASFLFDYVCKNRIVWGAEGYQEIKLRHTAGAPHRYIEEVAPILERMAESSVTPIESRIIVAQAKKIGDQERVREFLAKRFTKSQAAGIVSAHLQDEGRPIETLWDATTGITAYARGISYQDERVKLEREAGKVLALAA